MQYAATCNLKKSKAGLYNDTTPEINGQISNSFQYFFD